MNIDFVATGIALATFFGISALMALSLNLEYGVAGIPNFGQALFVSIGAYTTALTYTYLLPVLAAHEAIYPCGSTLTEALQLRTGIIRNALDVGLFNLFWTFLIAAAIGGLVGYLASYPALRVKEEWYLALVLLVASEIVRIIVRGYEPIICAHNGMSGIAQPFVAVGDSRLASILFAGLVLALVAVVFLYSERLIRSPYGRLLKAVRENDQVAQSLGKQVARVRGQIMFIGSAIAAISGVLFVINLGFASANDYVVALTLDVWLMVVLGGIGNNWGALLGAFVVTVLDRVTAIAAIQLDAIDVPIEFTFVRFLLFGVIILIMLRFRPQGLVPEKALTTKAHQVLQS
ncbi:MAG TPA: branched-chain amino acid ABC transporter permease [Anaerolineae bacterium]